MDLTLCPTCRLPVNANSDSCPLCTSSLKKGVGIRPVQYAAAAVAMLATSLALLSRRSA